MREEKSKVIGAHTYLVRQMPVMQGQRLFVKMVKTAWPMLVMPTAKTELSVMSLLAQFFDRVSEDEIESLTQQLAKYSEVDGKPLAACFDVHFHKAGHLSLWSWLGFALEVQFADFFVEGFGGVLDRLRNMASEFQMKSGGQPGGSSSTESQPSEK